MEIVNPVPGEELEGWTQTLLTAFLAPPDPRTTASSAAMWRDRLEPARTWGARDHGRWVATLATDERRITVPGGGELTIDALTAVTVNGTHRRRGLLTTMLTESLAQARERGDAASYLVAAEWPIYGRFGYAPATRQARYVLHSREAGAVIAPGSGTVRQVDAAEFAELSPSVGDAAQLLRAGEINRRPSYWRSQLEERPREGRLNLFVHEGADGPDGLLGWKPVRDFELGEGLGAVEVAFLVAASDDAYRGLWSYLAGLDVVDEVRLAARLVDEPVRWLLRDGRALQTCFEGDFTWLALLDVPAALRARAYRATGGLVLDVVDDSITGYASGRWQLDVSPEGATCTPTTRSPDLTVAARHVASAYLGGYPLAVTRHGGGVDEHTTGAAATFDLLFGTALAPYCGVGF